MEVDKKNHQELARYRQARSEGSQPFGTKTDQSEFAMRESDRLGRAFRADDLATTYYPDLAATIRPLTADEKEAGRAT